MPGAPTSAAGRAGPPEASSSSLVGRLKACCLGRAVAQAANCMEQEGLTVEELTKLFSVLSHDLKSPIFSVDGFSELLITDYTDCLDEEGQDFLRRIRSSVQQMKKVLD